MLALADGGISVNEYRNQIREQILQAKFVSRHFRSKVRIEKEDIEDYYKRNMDTFYDLPSYRIRLILFTTGNEDALKDKIKAVEEGLRDGVAFTELVSLYSDGPAIEEGGDLGYITAGEMDKIIEEVALQLKPGEVSNPFSTSAGINIIQLLDRKSGDLLQLKEVRNNIHALLYEKMLHQIFDSWLEEIREIAHIDVRL